MSGILDTNFQSTTKERTGRQSIQSGAVKVRFTFACIVTALLALLSIAMSALIYFAVLEIRNGRLVDDPGT